MAKIHFIYLDIGTGTYRGVNHGIASLSAVLKHNSHSVSLHHITRELSPNEVLDKITENAPDLIGFSSATNQYHFVEKYSEAISQKVDTPIVVGGMHATLCPEDVILDKDIDFVCVGEGENALLELANRIDKKASFSDIQNLWLRDEDGRVIRNKSELQVKDLDKLPYPDYDIFDMELILRATGMTLYLTASRGCPFDCSYCCNYSLRSLYNTDKYVRFHSVNYMIKMIEELVNKFKPKQLFFEDDTLSLNKKWCIDLCREYKERIGLPFGANVRLDTICEDLVAAMRDAGCNRLNFGIESGNEWLRKNILNRNISNRKIIDSIAIIKKYNIRTYSYNIIGFPFETEEMIEDTIEINKSIKVGGGDVFFFYPYPTTKLYKVCNDYGLLLKRDKGQNLSSYMKLPSIKLEHISIARINQLYAKLSEYLIEQQFLSSRKRFESGVILSLMNIIKLLLKMGLRFISKASPTLFNKLIFGFKQNNSLRRLVCCLSAREGDRT